MSAFATIPDGASIGEIPSLSRVNLDQLRTQHASDTAPVSPVEGQLWTTKGVTKQFSSGAWHDLWQHGTPMLTMPHATGLVSDGAKFLLPFRAGTVKVRVHHTSRFGTVQESATLTFFDNGLAEEVLRVGSGDHTAATDNIQVVCVIEDDGITLSRRNDTGGYATLVDFSALGPINDTPVPPLGSPVSPTYVPLQGVSSAPHLLATLHNDSLAVRGHHAGPGAPVNLTKYMLWANTADGWLYQLLETTLDPVWSAVVPLGKDLAFAMFARFDRYPREVGPGGDGFDTAAFVVGFTPRAVLLTVRCRVHETATASNPDVLLLEHDRTYLFVDPDLGSANSQAPILVADKVTDAVPPSDPVEKTIQCMFGANSVDIDKLDVPVSTGDGFSTIKLMDVTVFS